DEGDEDAKKALAAMDSSEDSEEEDKDAPAAEDASEDEPAAEAEGEEEEEEEDKPAPSASSSLDVAKELIALKRQVTAMQTKDQRAALLAKRPDLTADKNVKALLSKMSLPELKEAVKVLPRSPLPNPAAATQLAPTQGKGQGGARTLAPGEIDVAALMGVRTESPKITREAGVTTFARMTASQAREALASKAKVN